MYLPYSKCDLGKRCFVKTDDNYVFRKFTLLCAISNSIRMLLFNNQDKISNDISLFLTTNEVDYEPPNELLLNN